jgi:hypothetical protein
VGAGGLRREQGAHVQPAQEGGEEGEEHRLEGIEARARGCAIRLGGGAQGGWALGRGWLRK